jgi:large subunit ribosomal protein L7/L12
MIEVDKIQYLQIGVQGENNVENLDIDMAAWIEKYPGAVFHILFKPYNAIAPSPMNTVYEDGVLTWIVDAGATAAVGVEYTEIRAHDAATGLLKKSRIIPTVVENSVSGIETDPPESYQAWVTSVLNAGTAAVNAEAAAEEAKNVTVVLTSVGDAKVGVIKVVRTITGLGLVEAKKLVDALPAEIKKDVPADEADNIKKQLVDAGATVEYK